MKSERGKHFDPRVLLDVCLGAMDDVVEVRADVASA